MTTPPAGASGAAHDPVVVTVDGTPDETPDETPGETRAEDEKDT